MIYDIVVIVVWDCCCHFNLSLQLCSQFRMPNPHLQYLFFLDLTLLLPRYPVCSFKQ